MSLVGAFIGAIIGFLIATFSNYRDHRVPEDSLCGQTMWRCSGAWTLLLTSTILGSAMMYVLFDLVSRS